MKKRWIETLNWNSSNFGEFSGKSRCYYMNKFSFTCFLAQNFWVISRFRPYFRIHQNLHFHHFMEGFPIIHSAWFGIKLLLILDWWPLPYSLLDQKYSEFVLTQKNVSFWAASCQLFPVYTVMTIWTVTLVFLAKKKIGIQWAHRIRYYPSKYSKREHHENII